MPPCVICSVTCWPHGGCDAKPASRHWSRPVNGLTGHLTFDRFLSTATAKDEWPFVLVSVRHVDWPVDFFWALTLLIEDRKALRWLTLMEYLVALRGTLDT